jgi:peroxiredoxin
MKNWKRLWIAGLVVGLLVGCDSPEEEAQAEEREETEEVVEEEVVEEVALEAPSEPVIGQLAPDFTLVDEVGTSHTLSEYRGKTVVLEWFNIPCPFVRRHYEAGTFDSIIAEHGSGEFVWLAIDTTWDNTPADTLAWKEGIERSHDYPVLQDPDGAVGRLYKATRTPEMFVIDPEGILRYMGAIDDKPRGPADEATNHVIAALTALSEGLEIDPTETEPYGCTVKYEEES